MGGGMPVRETFYGVAGRRAGTHPPRDSVHLGSARYQALLAEEIPDLGQCRPR